MDKGSLKGKLAVVTGADSGIGLNFTKVLAGRGADIVMVSNNKEGLSGVAEDISAQFNIKTYPCYCDLTLQSDIDNLYQYIDNQGLEPDFLINNAGIFGFAPVSEIPERKIEAFIDLHVRAVTELTRHFGALFARRGHGRILNMSSMSCWMPMPGIAMYSATKAYIRVFSRAMHYELRDYGVSLTVACPGGIATDLFGLPENLKSLAVRIGALQTPEKFARKAIDKMLAGKKQYINGVINRLAIFFVAILPTPVRMMIKHQLLDRGIKR